MRWASITAAVLGLVGSVCAQGSLGGSQTSCSAAQAWVYQGCYSDTQNGRHGGFNWQLSVTAGAAKSYPGFTNATQMTVDLCLQACRGHAFRWALLYGTNQCYCSSGFPVYQSVTNTSVGPGAYSGTQPGTPTQDSTSSNATINTCHVAASPCAGNPAQFCGSSSASDIYMDPSYQYTSSQAVPSNYLYFGCYNNVSPGPFYVSIKTTSTVACQTYCGQLGYPFSARSAIDSQTSTSSCECGTEIQAGFEQAESVCSYYCNGTTGAQ